MKTVRIIKNTNGAGRMQIQDGCIVQYREELTDLTIDAPVVHAAMQHLTSPHIRAGGRCCQRSCRGA